MPTRMETADQMARFVALLLHGDFAAVKIVLSGTWRSMLFLDGRVSADEKQRHLRPIAQQLGSGRSASLRIARADKPGTDGQLDRSAQHRTEWE